MRAAPALAAASSLRATLQQELGGEIFVGEEVARGALTVVFLGVEARSARQVMIDVVPPERMAAERERAQRLLRAARACAKLRHPRIAPVLRVAAGDRLCWFVTRHDAGDSLETLMQRESQLPVERAAMVIHHVAAALACAHEHGVVHGALTPSSIVLDDQGGLAVHDLGTARVAGGATASPYEAPEVAVDGGAAPASDQYALAVIVWRMLTGHLPFAAGPGGVHRPMPEPPLPSVRPDVPPALGTVLERALGQRPGDRYPNVSRFAQAFRFAVQGRGSAAGRTAARRPTEGLLLGPESGATAAGRRLPRRPVLLGALGAGTLLAIGGLSIWQSRGDALSPLERQRLVTVSESWRTTAAGGQTRPVFEPAVRQLPPMPAPTGEPAEPRSRPTTPPARGRTTRPAPGSRLTATGIAYLTIGTNPQSAIFINDTPVPSNPVRNWAVRSGTVTLRFEVLDTMTGVWTRDTVVTVAAGDTLNLRRIRLARP